MSRKHFVLLAAALRVHRASYADPDSIYLVDDLIYSVALVCDANNPNFSYDRFYTASNYKGRDDA